MCQYCSDSLCDGENCESPFDHDDYHEASMFFMQTLSTLVVNAKLERPLDSHAPQTEHVYAYVDDDWGGHTRKSIAINGNRPTRTSSTLKHKTHSQRKTPTKKKLSLKSRSSKIVKTLMRMTKTITVDIRKSLRRWMHTYLKCRLCHVMK